MATSATEVATTNAVPVRFVRGDGKDGEDWECDLTLDVDAKRRRAFGTGRQEDEPEGEEIKSMPWGGSIDASVSISENGDVIQSVEVEGAMMSEKEAMTGDEQEVYFRLTHDEKSKEVVVRYIDRKD